MNKTQTTPVAKTTRVRAVPAPKLVTPPTQNPFGTFVASKVAKKPPVTTLVTTITAPAVAAKPVLAVQNGRKAYSPGTIGERIWNAANELQKHTPNTPVTAGAVRIALPDVSPASVSAGLSHWRQFCGTLRAK